MKKPATFIMVGLLALGLLRGCPSNPEAQKTSINDWFHNQAVSWGQARATAIHELGGSINEGDVNACESAARNWGLAKNREEIDEFVRIAMPAMREELNLLEAGK